ncbi:helix-turn-helix transcriptional regulator [Streptomyces sp. NPDC046712]|uniref:helix-turn-helix domain-containing protein n=1 Tax=Streptomyces sp. NPDC046712 TaxID=3154802 RepID=UPI0033C39950
MGTDGEDLAGFLRELKERSGLSYGALAKQLHMSPSTVHRYCNSDAVATDFAPVEKIARRCGASREELLRLHRIWIVADEARRRAKAASANAQPGDPQDQKKDLRESQALQKSQDLQDLQESQDLQEPQDLPEPQEPQDLPEPQEPATPAPTVPRPRRRRWPLAAAAAAAIALIVAVTAAVTATTLWSSAPDAPPARDQLDARPRAPQAPLTADVDPYVWKDPCSQVYVVDQPPKVMPPPPSELEARGWVTALSGVPGGDMVIDVALQGIGDETVVLKALHVRTVGVSEPLAGNAYVMGVGCGGDARLQSLDINLDAARPRPVPVAGYQGDRFVPASDFPFKVSASDPQVLRITAHTRGRSVRWYLELEWSSGGRSGLLRLDDKGRPFTTSAAAKLPTYQFPLGASAWEPFQAG